MKWHKELNRKSNCSKTGGNKLRTYKLFKQSYETEHYCNLILPRNHRSAFSRFRCGVAPIRLEKGRYERLPEAESVCPFCNSEIENEIHVMLNCPLYDDIRYNLFEKAKLLNVYFVY